MAKIQQVIMIFLARLKVQIVLDFMGWQMAMYRSTVKAVRDNADASIPKYWKTKLIWFLVREEWSMVILKCNLKSPIEVAFEWLSFSKMSKS